MANSIRRPHPLNYEAIEPQLLVRPTSGNKHDSQTRLDATNLLSTIHSRRLGMDWD